MEHITREEAYDLLKKYNKDPFHIQHALTVEAVMKWYTEELGFGADAEYWGIVGLLHDIDFELYPEEHCIKAPELLREGGFNGIQIFHVIHHEIFFLTFRQVIFYDFKGGIFQTLLLFLVGVFLFLGIVRITEFGKFL